jgi:hypothetical protein
MPVSLLRKMWKTVVFRGISDFYGVKMYTDFTSKRGCIRRLIGKKSRFIALRTASLNFHTGIPRQIFDGLNRSAEGFFSKSSWVLYKLFVNLGSIRSNRSRGRRAKKLQRSFPGNPCAIAGRQGKVHFCKRDRAGDAEL